MSTVDAILTDPTTAPIELRGTPVDTVRLVVEARRVAGNSNAVWIWLDRIRVDGPGARALHLGCAAAQLLRSDAHGRFDEHAETFVRARRAQLHVYLWLHLQLRADVPFRNAVKALNDTLNARRLARGTVS